MNPEREERHRMWCEQDYQNTRRALRFAIWWCVGIVALVVIAVGWAHR
jgi:hypothetical protein